MICSKMHRFIQAALHLPICLFHRTSVFSKQRHGSFRNIGAWCNGSTHALGACSPSSNLGAPTEFGNKYRTKEYLDPQGINIYEAEY